MIRAAEPADLPVLAAVLGDWVAQTAWMPKLHSTAEDLGFLHQLFARATLRVVGRPALGFLARQDGEEGGGEEVGEVLALYLAPEARGRGLGRALMAEAMAAEPALRLWTFAANAPARAFYAALGFVETGGTPGDNDEGLPDIRLEWRRDHGD